LYINKHLSNTAGDRAQIFLLVRLKRCELQD